MVLNAQCLEAKTKVYKAIVRPILKYACVIWFPHTTKDVTTLEAIQSCVARSACYSGWIH